MPASDIMCDIFWKELIRLTRLDDVKLNLSFFYFNYCVWVEVWHLLFKICKCSSFILCNYLDPRSRHSGDVCRWLNTNLNHRGWNYKQKEKSKATLAALLPFYMAMLNILPETWRVISVQTGGSPKWTALEMSRRWGNDGIRDSSSLKSKLITHVDHLDNGKQCQPGGKCALKQVDTVLCRFHVSKDDRS